MGDSIELIAVNIGNDNHCLLDIANSFHIFDDFDDKNAKLKLVQEICDASDSVSDSESRSGSNSFSESEEEIVWPTKYPTNEPTNKPIIARNFKSSRRRRYNLRNYVKIDSDDDSS